MLFINTYTHYVETVSEAWHWLYYKGGDWWCIRNVPKGANSRNRICPTPSIHSVTFFPTVLRKERPLVVNVFQTISHELVLDHRPSNEKCWSGGPTYSFKNFQNSLESQWNVLKSNSLNSRMFVFSEKFIPLLVSVIGQPEQGTKRVTLKIISRLGDALNSEIAQSGSSYWSYE